MEINIKLLEFFYQNIYFSCIRRKFIYQYIVFHRFVQLLIFHHKQKKSNELEKLRPIVEEQQTKIAALEEKTGWLERRLAETEVRHISITQM